MGLSDRELMDAIRHDRVLARMIRNERVNRKHATSLLSGKAAKRFDWLTIDGLVSAMAAVGPQTVCRIVKQCEDELDYTEQIRKAA
jgi:hypothetical protein